VRLAGLCLLAAVFCVALAPAGVAASRYAAIVIDADSGRVLHEAYADDRKYPASLTKMMTLYLLFEALEKRRYSIDGFLPVSSRAEGMPPSKLGLRRGSKVKIRDLILALITKSANDAAVVVAESLAKSEVDFAKLMTAKAKALGMLRTEFRNASGLPNRYQKSTARDMATLARALIRDFPQYYRYFSTAKFSYKGRSYGNHNSLLKSYSGADGIKTGYIRASGFNLVASAERGGRRLIAVVFGGRTSRSRDSHMTDLLNRGFAEIAQAVLRPPAAPRRNPFQLAAGQKTIESAAALPAAPDQQPPNQQIPSQQAQAATPVLAETAVTVTALAEDSVETPQAAAASPAQIQAQMQPPAQAETAPGAGAATTIAALIPTVLESEAGEADEAPLDSAPTWGIQVGAFSQFQPAHSATEAAQARLPDMLVATKTVIRQVNANGSQLYRAQLIGLTEPTAREVCRLLKSSQQSCIVVPPQRAAQSTGSAAG
jgi:D-alanyl-D-alanine carboxypeptidase